MPTTQKTAQQAQTTIPATPKQKPSPSTRPKLLPPHAVVLHNDSVNGFDYVVGVLRRVFHYGGGKAFWLTLRAHCAGRSIIWSGSLEVAELKSDQVRACGPDPRKIRCGGVPLKTSVEALPG
jgi:ATP-dependent Clp protease adaptor protein ClpS